MDNLVLELQKGRALEKRLKEDPRAISSFKARRVASRNAELEEALAERRLQAEAPQIQPPRFTKPPVQPQARQQFQPKAQLELEKAQAREIGKAKGVDIDTLKTFEANFPELEQTVNRLDELSEIASFGALDVGADFIRRQTGSEPSKGAIAKAEFDATTKSLIFPLLSKTFKGTISDSEREALLSTLADTKLSPKEKQAQLKSFIVQKTNDIKSLRRKLGQEQPSQFQEGQTAVNPSTGERIVFKGGQWQKM